MKLSVIVPVYNAEPYLAAALESVLSQTLRDLEVICVDDGSTDGSAAALADITVRDPRVRVLTQANAGQGAARNRGLELARGEFVYFMDADDELVGPDEFAYLIGESERESLDMLFFDAETRVDAGAVCAQVNAGDYIRTRDYSKVWSGPDLFAALCAHRDYTVSPCLVIARRDFLRRNGIRFAEGVIHEDNVFMLRAILSATRASHRPRRAYVRCVHAGTTMTKPLSVRNLRGYVACYLDGQEWLAENDYPCHVRQAIVGRLIRYRLQIGKIARTLTSSEPDFACGLTDAEHAVVQSVLRRNRLSEMVVAVWFCLQDRGPGYTFGRICSIGRNHA